MATPTRKSHTEVSFMEQLIIFRAYTKSRCNWSLVLDELNVSKEVEREVARMSTPLQQDDTQDDGQEDQVEEPQQEPQPSGLANRFTAIPIADDEDEEEAVQPPPKKKGAMEMARDTYQAYQDHLDRLRPIENKMERCMDKYLSS
ncbi:Hypothetical predicted protein [Mytilus galloprovincialis]|uniref:Uncharacterized protein n=1 Tax=Mytilus galloprovincialis TaxID=29158 RepID=A0A8B6F1L4_MYTGA|nr:Hypothetical predicted protein [Mytilus galloprovincialis]